MIFVQKFGSSKTYNKCQASLQNNNVMGKINKIMEKRYRQCVDSRGV